MLVGDGMHAGWLGELHPAVAAAWDLEGTVAGFELDFGVLAAVAPPVERYEDLTSFPRVRQDLAVVVADDVPAARVLERRPRRGRRAAGSARACSTSTAARRSARDARSLAIRLEFRAADRTLTDEEVAQRREKIVAALRDQVGGELRA